MNWITWATIGMSVFSMALAVLSIVISRRARKRFEKEQAALNQRPDGTVENR